METVKLIDMGDFSHTSGAIRLHPPQHNWDGPAYRGTFKQKIGPAGALSETRKLDCYL